MHLAPAGSTASPHTSAVHCDEIALRRAVELMETAFAG